MIKEEESNLEVLGWPGPHAKEGPARAAETAPPAMLWYIGHGTPGAPRAATARSAGAAGAER